jgi:hypothetical protein
MPSLCGSAEATRGWFRAFTAHSFLTCRPLGPRGVRSSVQNFEALAAKGNGPAQRAVIEAVQAIEREIAAQVNDTVQSKASEMSDLDVARRIAFLLTKPFAGKLPPRDGSEASIGDP